MPVLPFYTLSRMIYYAALRRPERLARVLAAAPFLLAVQLASAAGHSLGLLFGMGDAEARFSMFEMNEFRQHQEPVAQSQG
jgi:malonyl CoA-acyl carrier protein transacylase